jgi:uncharacterized membrane protein
VSLSPLLAAPLLVQLHVTLALAALVAGAARVAWPHGERMDRMLGWGFLALLAATAVSAVLLARPAGSPHLFGITVGHLFIAMSGLGLAAAWLTARRRDRMRWRNLVTALFAGVLVMAGLFEVTPGRLLHTVLAGG